MGANPDADRSVIGLPRAHTLYGDLAAQLKEPDSFTSCLKKMLAGRRKYRLAEAEFVAAPETEKAVCVLLMALPDESGHAITALNFGRTATTIRLDSAALAGIPVRRYAGRPALELISGASESALDADGRLSLRLEPRSAKTLVLR
jgi:hypothetical protein